MEIIKSYTLYLNTRQANNGDSNNCTFHLPTPIILSNNSNRFLVSASDVQLPYSFSQINTTNSSLPYTYTDTTGSFNSTLIIPSGNYNITSLLSQLVQSLLLDIYIYRPSSTLSTNSFSFTYNQSTSKCFFFMTYASTITIVLKFSLSTVLGIMLGFPTVNQTFGTTIKLSSVNKVDVNPITSVFIRSDTLKFATSYEAVIQPFTNSDVVCKIPITTLPNSIIFFRSDHKQMVNNTDISSLNLYLSDNISNTYSLEMNGLPWGMTFNIDEVQMKKNNTGTDKITTTGLSMPAELTEERDKIINDLIDKKLELEKNLQIKK